MYVLKIWMGFKWWNFVSDKEENDSKWPISDHIGRQELQIVIWNEHNSFTTSKIGSLVDVQSCHDPEGFVSSIILFCQGQEVRGLCLKTRHLLSLYMIWVQIGSLSMMPLVVLCNSRNHKVRKERHKILMDRNVGDRADSAEDSGSSQPYPSTLPGIPKGSARQLFQHLQGPMEEDTLKSHFECVRTTSSSLDSGSYSTSTSYIWCKLHLQQGFAAAIVHENSLSPPSATFNIYLFQDKRNDDASAWILGNWLTGYVKYGYRLSKPIFVCKVSTE
ncbi:hypothetical protein IFM89_019536 [Coptis chinensis]|uniref:Uncharacterized protein n=1 Tax=Coptis chinensis TaxID=261450 RepID=A0A835HZT3_9MAGN|nr:hypothetical protein IFM89_019536 [Coptis chinensis]